MLEKKIKLTEYEEVKEFVHAAEKCDFDIDVLMPNLCWEC